MPNLGLPEIIIIAVVLLVLFGGTKLAGLGKSTGRALREFKEETRGLKDADKSDEPPADPPAAEPESREPEPPAELTDGRSADEEYQRDLDRDRDQGA